MSWDFIRHCRAISLVNFWAHATFDAIVYETNSVLPTEHFGAYFWKMSTIENPKSPSTAGHGASTNKHY